MQAVVLYYPLASFSALPCCALFFLLCCSLSLPFFTLIPHFIVEKKLEVKQIIVNFFVHLFCQHFYVCVCVCLFVWVISFLFFTLLSCIGKMTLINIIVLSIGCIGVQYTHRLSNSAFSSCLFLGDVFFVYFFFVSFHFSMLRSFNFQCPYGTFVRLYGYGRERN